MNENMVGRRLLAGVFSCVLAAALPAAAQEAAAPAAAPVATAPAPAPAAAPVPPVVQQGRTVKLSSHVYVIPDDKVGMVPNVGIVVGSRATLVVDPGMGIKSGQAVLAEMQKLSRNTEIYIVNTHFHPEHTTGEAAFPAGAKVLRAVAQQQDVDEMGMKWVNNFRARSPVIADVLQGITAFRVPHELFEKEKLLDLGGVRARVIRLGPGHTRGDTVVYVEGDGVLFSGDLAMRQLFPAFSTPQSRSRSWLASLDRMEALRPRTVVGAHYPLADASVIGDYRNYIRALQSRVVELKKQGRTADETGELLRAEFAAKYPDWDQPARVLPAAAIIYAEMP